MHLFFRFRSFRTNIVLAFVLVILMTILIMSVTSYYLSRDSVQKNAEAYTTELVKQVNQNIESYISGMKYMSDLAAGNRNIQQYLSASSFGSLEEEKKLKESISDFLESMLVSRTDIASVNVFGSNGKFVSGRKDFELNPFVDIHEMKWYRDAVAAGGDNVISSSHVQPIFKGRYPWVVSLSRELISRDGGRKLGVFLVDLNFSVMNDMLKDIQLGQRGYLFIVDAGGQIVYHPQQQLVYSNLKSEMIDKVLEVRNGTFTSDEGSGSRMYTVRDSEFGWKIVGVSYVNELVANQHTLRLSFIILGLICIVIAIMISVILSQRISRPIKQLEQYMKEVEKGNFDIHVPVPRTIEIGRLARTFNIMVGKIKELMEQVVLNQEQKRKSEINALQAQINPHFLYNTLDSIVWMAESNKSKEVVVMTSALARLLRASISKGEELVPIATEIEHIANYLKIQKMRYSDKLDYRIDIHDSVRHFQTIKVILQPIVENAIYHGIKMRRGPGCVTIRSEESDSDVLLIVEDDGRGMDEETCRTIMSPAAAGRAQGRGVGVRNVHERLQLYYGAEYGLSYSSTLGVGTKVTIRLSKTSKAMEGGKG
ncbi:sensor histidine kinase [Paenibacillus sp. LHD-117]|uniref:cache domain-containing sensor histidine kinase n=1 Tax=Paenibacillus sp. LHD-117 TaxID=3071412 RepID=UPI0027DFE6AD|nr:sensor histidine kinase [Paenibacillus sp. LHD-117]MDQ6422447.1 sensor histidine kinase [Paenibacillus sp. LHD-117]